MENSIRFRNGSEITAIYEPFPEFYCSESVVEDTYPVRGRRLEHTVIDEFGHINFYTSVDDTLSSFLDTWNSIKLDPIDGRFVFRDDGKLYFESAKAPDFGELSPSQELNDFVNTLAQGE